MDSKELAGIIEGIHYGEVKPVIKIDEFQLQGSDCGTCLYWISSKMIDKITNPENLRGIYIVPKIIKGLNTQIHHKSPRIAFSKAIEKLSHYQRVENLITQKTCSISKSVQINKSVRLGKNIVIHDGCIIGNNVVIGSNSILMHDCIIGDNVIIGNNSIVGGEGFGFEKIEDGEYEKIAHIGSVTIEDNVFIGDCVTIARGTIRNTIIKRGVKIDNHVHIAHNCILHEDSIFTAGVTLSGSVIVGRNCWLGPNSTIFQKVNIVKNCKIGIGSVVLKDCKESGTYFGVPAKLI
jgi:UDP-3-O-[3-hydroxymyristoyl] glucosamine N-acyltransferase